MRSRGYREKSDVWSLGSVLYNFVSGKYLFRGDNNQELIQANKVCNLEKVFKYIEGKSPEC